MLYPLRTRHTGYFTPTVEIKDYVAVTDGQNVFNQPGKNDLRTYNNVRKITIGKELIGQLDIYYIILILTKKKKVNCNRFK